MSGPRHSRPHRRTKKFCNCSPTSVAFLPSGRSPVRLRGIKRPLSVDSARSTGDPARDAAEGHADLVDLRLEQTLVVVAFAKAVHAIADVIGFYAGGSLAAGDFQPASCCRSPSRAAPGAHRRELRCVGRARTLLRSNPPSI